MFFGAMTPNSLYGFDEPQTLLVSPSESHDLATRDQPGMGMLHAGA